MTAGDVNEQYLFNGTKILDPIKKIIESQDIGWNLQYAGDTNWGKGIYFAINASYS